jgi:uncharacterized protein (TIGR03437 family)
VINKFVILALVSACLGIAQTGTLNVSRDLTALSIAGQNMLPNVPTQDSRALLEAAVTYAQSKKIGTLTADPGSYYFLTGRTNVKRYLDFSNLSNLTFDLAGSNLYFQSGSWPGIWCTNCQNVQFQNFTMDALQLPYTQVKVTSADAANKTISYAAMSSWEAATNFNTVRTPAGTTAEPLYAFVFRNGSPLRTTSRMNVQRPIGTGSLTVVADGSPWSNPSQLANVQAGDVLVITARAGNATLMLSGGSGNVIRNVAVYYGSQVGVMLQASPGALVEQVQVVPRPGTDRLMSSNADGIGAVQVGQNVTIRRSRIRRTGDDGISPNSQQIAVVTGQTGVRTIQATRAAFSNFPNGTNVQIIDNTTGTVAATAKVAAQDPVYSTATPIFGGAMTLTLDQDISPVSKNFAVVYADAAFRGAGLLVENNLIQDPVFARGISVWGLLGGTFQGNLIRNVPWSAINILAKAKVDDWMTGPVANVTIQRNAIEQYSGTFGSTVVNALAGINVLSTDLNNAYVTTSPFQNLTMANNFISSGAYSGMLIGNTNGASVTGNLLMNVSNNPTANAPPGSLAPLLKQPIATNNSANVTQSENTIDTTVVPAFVTSGVSFSNEAVAPDSWAAVFGTNLVAKTSISTTAPFPTNLDGTTVTIADSAGVARLAPIWFVSAGQINYLVPTDCAVGAAVVTITSGGTVTGRGATLIDTLAPALFAADGSGTGPALGQALLIKPDGTFTYAPLNQPINTGSAGDATALVLYATGVRGATDRSGVAAYAGDVRLPVQYAGPVAGFYGLDQVNVNLPAQLKGAGAVTLQLSVNGLMSNLLTLQIN